MSKNLYKLKGFVETKVVGNSLMATLPARDINIILDISCTKRRSVWVFMGKISVSTRPFDWYRFCGIHFFFCLTLKKRHENFGHKKNEWLQKPIGRSRRDRRFSHSNSKPAALPPFVDICWSKSRRQWVALNEINWTFVDLRYFKHFDISEQQIGPSLASEIAIIKNNYENGRQRLGSSYQQ